MVAKRFCIVLFIVGLIAYAAAYTVGGAIPYEVQSKLLDTLRDTSAVLMAILGVWLAVMCPDILPKLFSGKAVEIDWKFLERFKSITLPLLIYALIICLEIVIPWVAMILKQIPLFMEHHELMRKISFFIISYLCMIQVLTILMVLSPVELVMRLAKINNQLTDFNNR